MTFRRPIALLEIAFWDVTVLLLSKSTFAQEVFREGYHLFARVRYHFNPTKMVVWGVSRWGLGVVLVAFLFIGMWSGRIAGRLAPSSGPMATLLAVSPPPTPANGQVNLLVIGVDRLNTRKPRLESIWLLGYFPNNPHISLVPVYPSPSGSDHGHEFENVLTIAPEGRPNPELANLLRNKQIWWNGYVLIDEIAIIEIVDFIGGVKVEGRLLNGALAVESFPLPGEDSSAAIRGQTRLLRAICHQANLISPSADLRNILNLIPNHITTDLDIFEAVRDWRKRVNSKQNLVCDFPLLNASLP